MKRMLASGVVDTIISCKAFRDGEQGSRHNPEFTLLEWYCLGWDEFQLITEIEMLTFKIFEIFNNSAKYQLVC